MHRKNYWTGDFCPLMMFNPNFTAHIRHFPQLSLFISTNVQVGFSHAGATGQICYFLTKTQRDGVCPWLEDTFGTDSMACPGQKRAISPTVPHAILART